MELKYLPKVKAFIRGLNVKKLILIYILIYSISPLVAVATSKYLTTYFYMGIVVLSVSFSFIACRLKNIKKFILFIIPFILFELIFIIKQGDPDVLLSGYRVLLFLMPICLGYYVFHHESDYQLYTVIIVGCFTLTVISTIVGCISNPGASRALATVSDSQDPSVIKYSWLNIGGFGFVYSAIQFFPLVILAFKKKSIHIALFVIFTVLLFSLAINTEYTLALMMLLFSSILFFVKFDITPRRFAALFIFGLIVALLLRGPVASLISYIADLIGNEDMSEKMNAMMGGVESVKNIDDNRLDLYLLSINTFLKNPFFGTLFSAKPGYGGHSFILDNLARFGMLGGLLMFFMYRGIFKTFYAPFSDRPGYIIIIWLFLQTIALSAVNTGMWESNLCLYFPILLCMLYREKDERTPLKASLEPREEEEQRPVINT